MNLFSQCVNTQTHFMESSEKTEMKTLTSCMRRLQSEGFNENFIVRDKKLVASGERSYDPDQVKILNFYRFEGESDPADSAILYAVETNDGLRGLLSDAYGAYADEHISKFTAKVEEISKINKRGQTEEVKQP